MDSPSYDHSLKQIQNFVAKNKSKLLSVLGGNTMGHVNSWATENVLTKDTDYDTIAVAQGFRATADVDSPGDTQVFLLLTSMRLMMEAKRFIQDCGGYSLVSSDDTHGLTSHGYPANVIGLLGHAGQFIPIGVSIKQCEDEAAEAEGIRGMKAAFQSLLDFDWVPTEGMMDSCPALRNAFKSVFPDIKLAVCWFHCTQALHKNRAKFSDPENYKKFCEEVRALHILEDLDTFTMGLELLKKRWRTKEPRVVAWFFPNWGCPGRMEWFMGATACGMPVVNSSEEGFNNTMKRYGTRRKSQGIGIMLPQVARELGYQSRTAPANYQRVRQQGQADYIKAQEWLLANKALIITRRGSTYVPSSDAARELRHASRAALQQALTAWLQRDIQALPRESVVGFVARQTRFYSLVALDRVRAARAPDQIYRCSCPMGWKSGQCKHALALAIARGDVPVRDDWVVVAPCNLPRRGRPRNVQTQEEQTRRRRRRRTTR